MTGFELALSCLALNIYHESKDEPIIGQYAVAYVTLNRVQEHRSTVCKEVFRNKQFSWANHALDQNGKLLSQFIPSGKQWQQSRKIAKNVLNTRNNDFTMGAKWYHADYISKPEWANNMHFVGKYGKHIFYR